MAVVEGLKAEIVVAVPATVEEGVVVVVLRVKIGVMRDVVVIP